MGHVFAGRLKSLLVDRDNYLLQITRYLALNPLRAGIVSTAAAWPWSHHRAMAGIAPPAPCLTCDAILGFFDAHSRTAAQVAYRRFVESTGEDDESLRGSQALLARVARAIDLFGAELEIPQRERLVHRPALERLFDSVSDRGQRNRRIQEAHDISASDAPRSRGPCPGPGIPWLTKNESMGDLTPYC